MGLGREGGGGGRRGEEDKVLKGGEGGRGQEGTVSLCACAVSCQHRLPRYYSS